MGMLNSQACLSTGSPDSLKEYCTLGHLSEALSLTEVFKEYYNHKNC